MPVLLVALAALLGFPKLAPFTAVRWSDDAPEVRVDGAWHGLASIDGTPVDEIVSTSKRKYGSKWDKRFSEDLYELLSRMGKPPGPTVELVLIDLDSGARTTVDAAMTEENRRAAWEYNQRGRVRPERPRTASPPKEISAAAAKEDLAFLVETLRARHSYFRLKGVDAEAEADAIAARLDDPVDARAFALELTRFLARFGDGHTRLRANPNDVFPPGYLPFLIGVSGDRYVAFHDDRRGLLDDDHPYVVAIDGRPIEEWIEVGASMAADGSPRFRREHGARNVRFLQWARGELGIETADDVEVRLGAARGRGTKEITLRVADRKPTYGAWPRSESRWLDGKIGYLRIADMVAPDEAADVFEDLRRWMVEFRDARGLVIDVRGNGGGTRHLLRALLPYVLDPKRGPRVVNVAAKRLEPGDDPHDTDGLLGETRALFPEASSRHDAAAKKAIAKFRRSFRPKWKLPKGEFSDWHYMVVAPADGEDADPFERPVAVLIDPSCFSATDVFCAAFKGVDGVTLVGTPTGGGSGRSRPVRLPNSGFELRMSSMASFQPTGELFDGVGVTPDVTVETEPTDFVGETDAVLDRAIEVLRTRSG